MRTAQPPLLTPLTLSTPSTLSTVARLLTRIALFASLAGCGRCSPSNDADAGRPSPTSGPRAPSPTDALLPPPKPLTFSTLRGRTSVAIPAHCSLRAPITEAKLPASSRFIAEPRTLGTLIIADSAGDPPTLTGVAALTLDPAGETRDPRPIPWLDAASLPRLARGQLAPGQSAGDNSGTWLAAIERRGEGSLARVDLWRSGALDSIGEGDRFEAVDLACGERRCALLTSRLGKVAAAGADVWIGGANEPGGSWKRIELAPSTGESDAHPVGLAAVDLGVVAAIVEKGSCVFRLADAEGGPRELARLDAPHGVLDAIAAPDPIAMTLATPVDESGCVARQADVSAEETHAQEEADHEREGNDDAAGQAAPIAVMGTGTAGLRLERPGLPGIEIRTAAPPIRGALRRLTKGTVAVWIAPLGCKVPRRIVYAVVLDEKGAPLSEPMAVADGDRFAVASSGDSVDLWMEREDALTWVPLTCTAPSAR